MSKPTEFQQYVIDELAKRPFGTRTALAEYVGVTPDKITKSLNWEPGKETRKISVEEAEAIRKFFAEHPPGDVVPQEQSNIDRLIEEIKSSTDAEARMLLEVFRALRRTGTTP